MPASRIRVLRPGTKRPGGAYVLYWMIASRRFHHNFALDRALELATRASLPVLVLEPLRVAYPHASDRFHRFALDGMADNARTAEGAGVVHFPYVTRSCADR